MTLIQAAFFDVYDDSPSEEDAAFLHEVCKHYAARIQQLNGGQPIDPSKSLIGDYSTYEVTSFGSSFSKEFTLTLGIYDLKVNLFLDQLISVSVQYYEGAFGGRRFLS